MNSRNALRVFVVLEWVLIIAGVAFAFALEDSLPPPLREYSEAEADRELNLRDGVSLGSTLVMLPLFLMSSVGLFLLKRWARGLYLVLTLLVHAMTLIDGPMVAHEVAAMIGDLSVLASGLVLGVAFFSDALREERPPLA